MWRMKSRCVIEHRWTAERQFDIKHVVRDARSLMMLEYRFTSRGPCSCHLELYWFPVPSHGTHVHLYRALYGEWIHPEVPTDSFILHGVIWGKFFSRRFAPKASACRWKRLVSSCSRAYMTDTLFYALGILSIFASCLVCTVFFGCLLSEITMLCLLAMNKDMDSYKDKYR